MPANAHARPVESVTRVNVAFPFARITTTNPDLTETVHELVELVAALAAEVDSQHSSQATVDLVARARALEEALAG
jgi:hypothetical protein